MSNTQWHIKPTPKPKAWPYQTTWYCLYDHTETHIACVESKEIAQFLSVANEMLLAVKTLAEWFYEGQQDMFDPSVGIPSTGQFCCICQPEHDEHAEGCPIPLALKALDKLEES